MQKTTVISFALFILASGCSKETTKTSGNTATSVAAVSTLEDKPMPFVPDVPQNPLPLDHEISQFAQRIVDLDSGPWGAPEEALKLLQAPTPSTLPAHGGLRTQYWTYKTAEGVFELGLTYKDGTWEEPRGNGPPNLHSPEVIAIELTGPGYLELKPPSDAKTMIFNATDGAERQLSVWQDFAYFEQGHQGRPWMVARSVGRGTFHATTEERATLENVLIGVSDAMKKDPNLDLQAHLASAAKDFKTAENTYDFEIGKLEAVRPDSVTVSWRGPTKISRFFEGLGKPQIMTSFAHDYGDMAKNIELDHMNIRPVDYYILRPRMHYEESGAAAEAHFRSLQISRRR